MTCNHALSDATTSKSVAAPAICRYGMLQLFAHAALGSAVFPLLCLAISRASIKACHQAGEERNDCR